MHGVARVWLKNYSRERDRDLRRKRPRTRTAKPDGRWMRDLARDMAEMGLATPMRQGASPDGPLVH